MDCTALVWDVTGLKGGTGNKQPRTQDATAALLKTLFRADAEAAHRALWSLVADPTSTLSAFAEQWRELPTVDISLIPKYIADLDSTIFKVRQQAEQELERFGKRAEPALREALKQRKSLEVSRRLENLVSKCEGPVQSPEVLGNLRMIEVLDHIGNTAARELLMSFAKRTFHEELKAEALAAANRIQGRARRQ